MRQGQQNRRGRGRSNNNNTSNSSNTVTVTNHNANRKPHNPLSRNYESSGPDVKIRGTAAQIAEKYMALARDASASGDFVTAENYLQHAEHYNRIIAAAQVPAVPTQPNGSENGYSPNGQHRQQQDGINNFAMRDQPQPVVEQPQTMMQPPAPPVMPGMEPQPEIGAEPGAADDAASADPSDSVAPDGRRRRRRYPAGGTAASRAAAGPAPAAEPTANGHNGSGTGLDGAGDARPSDEALAN